jgi:hypothetical protein
MSVQQVQSAAVAVSFHGEFVGSYGHGWTPQEPHPPASLSNGIMAVCVAERFAGVSFGPHWSTNWPAGEPTGALRAPRILSPAQ